jgi:hypothetical protein
VNTKAFFIILVILIIINIIGYVTRPAKYRTQGSLESPAIAFVGSQKSSTDV